MKAKKVGVGDVVTVNMYHPETDDYRPVQAVVLEVSRHAGTVRCQHYIPRLGSSWYDVIDNTPNPARPAQRGGRITNGQLAARYGISLETLRAQWIDFVENEGYTGDGEEHETFGDYLDLYRSRIQSKAQSKDPFDGGRGAGAMGQPID